MSIAGALMRLVLAAHLALAASGCALFTDKAADASATAAPEARQAESTAQPGSAGLRAADIRLDIEAPAELQALLQRNLDLSRLAGLAGNERIDPIELQRLAAAAPAQARELAATEGYFAAEVSVQREADMPEGQAHLRLIVKPGPRTRVAQFTLATEGALDLALAGQDPAAAELLAALKANWPLAPGQVFRNSQWAAAKTALLARLRAAGYASASLSGSRAEIDPHEHQARLYAVVDSGPLYRAGDLRIEGLRAHDEATVRHLAGFGAGEALTEALLLDYQERLIKAGLFDAATVSFDPQPEQAARTPVLVDLNELPLQQATVGVGYSANTGQRVSLEHTHRRLLGRPLAAHNKLEWGRDRQVWEAELSTHPGAGFYRNLLGWQIERLQTGVDNVLNQRLRLGRTQDTQRIERLYYAGFDRSRQTTAATDRDARALGAYYQLVWRRLDSVVLPTQGLTLSLQGGTGLARSSYGESGPYGRGYARLTGYQPLPWQWYGQARLELGQIFKRDAVVVPDSLAFRAGGDDSVRGYAYRTLAPTLGGVIAGGNVLGTASIELAHPLATSMPTLWGALFLDAGNAALAWSDFKAERGYGIGLRWRSPVGPLRVDWAYGEALRSSRLHLSVGIAF